MTTKRHTFSTSAVERKIVSLHRSHEICVPSVSRILDARRFRSVAMDAFRLAFASLFAPTACLSLSNQPFSRLRPHNRELRPAPMPPIPRETMRRLHKTTQAGTIVLGDGGRAYLHLSVESLQKPSVQGDD